MKTVHSDIVDEIRSGQYDAAMHCCNCFHTMNSGVAKALREAFPSVYQIDKTTTWGDFKKLSDYSYVRINQTFIYNIYGQFNYGYDKGPYVIYEALFLGIRKVKYNLDSNWDNLSYNESKRDTTKIVIPKMGAGLAGGDWKIISNKIQEIFTGNYDITVCEWP